MPGAAIAAEAETLSAEISAAIDSLLDSLEAALARTDDREATAALNTALEACAIQDIAGQRLARIIRLARGGTAAADDPEGLRNGPSLAGDGLDQAAADALMEAGNGEAGPR